MKKKLGKKIAVFAIVTALVVAMLPILAFADDNAAKIGDQEYARLQDAINAATDATDSAKTVVLLRNVTKNDVLEVKMKNKNVILDLNGKTLTANLNINTEAASKLQFSIKDDAKTDKGKIVGNIVVTNCKVDLFGNATVEGSFILNGVDNVNIKGTVRQTDEKIPAISVNGTGVDGLKITNTAVVEAAGIAVKATAGTVKILSNSSTSKAEIGGTLNFDSGVNYVITGGVFTSDPTEFLGTGYEAIDNGDGTWTVDTIKVAQIGDTGYKTLVEAVNQVGEGETITILKDCESEGISIDKEAKKTFTIDFNEKKVTFNKPGAGSQGTTTQALHLEEGSTITIKNGKIDLASENKDFTWGSGDSVKGIAMIIQNYCNLSLENMEIDGTNIAHNGNNTRYMISNNSGTVKFDSVKIIAPNGDFAFDSCKYGAYDIPTVNVSGNSTITGKVEASGGIINFNEGSTVNGQIRVGENKNGGATGSVVTIAKGVTVNNQGNYAVVVFGENTLNIEGIINGIVGTNGNAYNAGSVINIKDGANITVTDDVAIYMPNGELNISGGTISGDTAVYFKSTKLNITGGLLIADGEKADYQYNGNGCNPTGDALVIDSCNYPSGIGPVSISGGMFKSENNNAVAAFTSQDGLPVTMFISAGYFSSKPNDDYIVDGYSAIKNDGLEVSKVDYPYTIGHAVTFNVDGGKPESKVIEVKHNGKVSKNDVITPSKDKNTFMGWVDVKGNLFSFDTEITENRTIIANWLPDDADGKLVVKDTGTGVKAETSIKKSDIPLSKGEVEAIKAGKVLDVNLVVKVEEAKEVDKTEVKLIEKAMTDEQKLGMYLDCSLLKTLDGKSLEIHETLNPITITLTVPENLRLDGRVYSIVRVHEGKAETLFEGKADKDWKISFATDKFSTYALLYEGGNPDTGDHNNIGLFACLGGLAILGIFAVAGVMIKRKSYRR